MDRYKLYQGDCLEIMKEMLDKSIDLIIVDPPYKTTKRGISKNTKQQNNIVLIRYGLNTFTICSCFIPLVSPSILDLAYLYSLALLNTV